MSGQQSKCPTFIAFPVLFVQGPPGQAAVPPWQVQPSELLERVQLWRDALRNTTLVDASGKAKGRDGWHERHGAWRRAMQVDSYVLKAVFPASPATIGRAAYKNLQKELVEEKRLVTLCSLRGRGDGPGKYRLTLIGPFVAKALDRLIEVASANGVELRRFPPPVIRAGRSPGTVADYEVQGLEVTSESDQGNDPSLSASAAGSTPPPAALASDNAGDGSVGECDIDVGAVDLAGGEGSDVDDWAEPAPTPTAPEPPKFGQSALSIAPPLPADVDAAPAKPAWQVQFVTWRP